MSALDDTRTSWPFPPGTAGGPRLASAIASRFAAGESIASLADDFGMPEADVALAIRVTLRALVVLETKVGEAIEAYGSPLDFGADPNTRPADTGFGEW